MTRESQPSSCPKMGHGRSHGHGHTWYPSDEEEKMILKMILETRSTLTKKTLILMMQKSMQTCTSMGACLCPNIDTHTHTSTSIMVACDVKPPPSWNSTPNTVSCGMTFPRGEEFTLGIDPKSLHTTVLMQMVYNAVIWHSGGFLKHMSISVTKRRRITVV